MMSPITLLRRASLSLPLLLLAAALLATGCGCGASHGSDSGSTAWAALRPIGNTLDQAEQEVGFRLVLPSYIPPQMKTYGLSFPETPATPLGEPGESVDADVSIRPLPLPGGEDRLDTRITDISITEWKRRPGEPQTHMPVEENMTIGKTAVTCHLFPNDALWVTPAAHANIPGVPTIAPGPTVNPSYTCDWDKEELLIRVIFSWLLPEPLPGLITSDMRDEALKVVTSMIEDPYIP